jgi:PhzF family phenazine biosynthesis protein
MDIGKVSTPGNTCTKLANSLTPTHDGDLPMTAKLYQVNAFTGTPFSGNPAAVCLLAEERQAKWMQNIAAEMNLSETAFLWPQAEGYSLRWFTPSTEVRLCGHATLASAHILWESGIVDRSLPAHFFTRSGRLTAVLQEDGIELDFPSLPAEKAQISAELLVALGEEAIETLQVGNKYLIVVNGEDRVRRLQPDFAALRQLPGRALMVTSQATTTGFDFISRFFAPWIGIDEDPVTGSAHCTLGPYWAKKLGKTNLRAYQASARGGVLDVRPEGDRVYLRGQAVTILSGELQV